MKVTFLGSGTSTGVPVPTCDCAVCRSDDPRDCRLRPSIVMEWNGVSILVDTSTDLRQQALRHRLSPVTIDLSPGRDETIQDLEECGLAGSIGSEQDYSLVLGYREGDVPQYRPSIWIAEADTLHFNHRRNPGNA